MKWSKTVEAKEPTADSIPEAHPQHYDLSVDDARGVIQLSHQFGHPREPWATESVCTFSEFLEGAMRAEITLSFGEAAEREILAHVQKLMRAIDLTPLILSNWEKLPHEPGLIERHDLLPYQNNAVYGRTSAFVLRDKTELAIADSTHPLKTRFLLHHPGRIPVELNLNIADVLPTDHLFFANSGAGEMMILNSSGEVIYTGRDYGISRFWVELRHFQRVGDSVIGMYRNDRSVTSVQSQVHAITGTLGYLEFDARAGAILSFCRKA
jgi:hypothetical protein